MQETRILDVHGRPFERDFTSRDMDLVDAELKLFGSVMSTYLQSLEGSTAPARHRAKTPLLHHPWMFAAAMATATVASQAPFTIFTESDKERQMPRRGQERRGMRRRAMERHSKCSIYKRITQKALEEDFSHELNILLNDPNPFQDGRQLWQMTFMLMASDGEAFWLYTDDTGTPVSPMATPTRIWCLSEMFLTPIYEGRTQGQLVGWEVRMPNWMPLPYANGTIEVNLDQITHFKLPNPLNPIRGISRMTPVALAIENDLAIATLNRKTLDNSGVPKGGLTYPGNLDPKAKEKLLHWWKQRHEGEANAAKVALLTGGLAYQSYALTPADAEYLSQQQWNKDQELAVMATPDSVLGISDAQTYATQLGQDKNFWDKNLIPLMRLMESAIDRSPLFFGEADSVMGLFDLSQVEALRAGLMDKILSAEKLCGGALHMDPKTAFSVVGVEVDEYEGDDVGLIPMSLIRVEDAIAEPEPVPDVLDPFAGGDPNEMPPGEPGSEEEPEGEDGDPEDAEEPKAGDAPGQSRSAAIHSSKARKASRARTQRQFLLLETEYEKKMRPRYRTWVRNERSKTLGRFAEATSSTSLAAARKAGKLDLRFILPDLKDSRAALTSGVRPLYPAATGAIFEFSLAEIGIPTFDIDDPRIVAFWDKRLKVFTQSTPQTVFNNLKRTLSEGIKAGEDFDALKARVAAVYDLSASSHKVLTVVRTETAGLMNGVRNQMFRAQGFAKKAWVNSGDESVREDHVTFDAQGPVDHTFDFMDLVGGDGELLHPGDPNAPANQTILCRCIEVPAE